MPARKHTFRVSHVERFREWLDNDDSLESLIADLTRHEPTEDMLRGTAFHAALETIGVGEVDKIHSQGFTFYFNGDFELPLSSVRETRREKNYGGIYVSGCVDGITGNHIIDHKAATWFDAERYLEKYLWRFYLDIFRADRFTWHIWEMKECDEPRVYWVNDLHTLEQYRYPGLERDCRELALKLKDFADKHLVGKLAGQPSTEELLRQSVALVNQQKKKSKDAALLHELATSNIAP